MLDTLKDKLRSLVPLVCVTFVTVNAALCLIFYSLVGKCIILLTCLPWTSQYREKWLARLPQVDPDIFKTAEEII